VRILSHRGYWKSPVEKNGIQAFERSFSMGFGTETDVRDLDGALVIAHDPPRAGALSAAEMFATMARHDPALPLAVNVKADGLQTMVAAALAESGLTNAFVFDMSVPDTLHWLRAGVPVFVRHSDVEPEPVLLGDAMGVWLDAFHDDWWGEDVPRRHLDAGKRVCIVSPELHGRDHRWLWDRLHAGDLAVSEALMLCTDQPEEAGRLFSHDH